jgi:hypothetical protein
MRIRLHAARAAVASVSLACVVGAAALSGAVPALASSAALSADRLAGFIQYIRWPGEAELRRWDVCVAGAPDAALTEGELITARGRPVFLRAVRPGQSLEGCQILDLTGLSPTATRAMLERSRRMPVLTIGEGEAFCTAGGTVCMRPAGAGGGFEVNLSALQDAGLNANAQLLMLGRRRQTAGAAP